jgi:hypothetical protein
VTVTVLRPVDVENVPAAGPRVSDAAELHVSEEGLQLE